MKALSHLARKAHAGLLALYPPAFRDEFGDEMKGVYADVVAEASERGALSLAAACLREFCDCPRAALHEHWVGLTDEAREIPQGVVYAVGGVWLTLGIWLVTRRGTSASSVA